VKRSKKSCDKNVILGLYLVIGSGILVLPVMALAALYLEYWVMPIIMIVIAGLFITGGILLESSSGGYDRPLPIRPTPNNSKNTHKIFILKDTRK